MTKRSWPLVALGVAAFIPGLGVIFGVAALSWGLVTDRPRAKLGAALGAIGAALNIGAAAFLIQRVNQTAEGQQAQQLTVIDNLGQVVAALEEDHSKHGRYPGSLRELVGSPIPRRLLNVVDLGHRYFFAGNYQYRLAADQQHYDLFSVGPDGKADTEDDIRPSLPDSVAARSGYRPGPPR